MKSYFYTIRDVREYENADARFDTLEEAVARYRDLPSTRPRALGVCADGLFPRNLVECHPIYPADERGEDVLVPEYRSRLFADAPVAASAIRQVCGKLAIDKMLLRSRVIAIPENDAPDPFFADMTLDEGGRFSRAVEGVYVVGRGWLTPPVFREILMGAGHSTPGYPFVEAYRFRYRTRAGKTGTTAAPPLEFDRILERTRLCGKHVRKAKDGDMDFFPER